MTRSTIKLWTKITTVSLTSVLGLLAFEISASAQGVRGQQPAVSQASAKLPQEVAGDSFYDAASLKLTTVFNSQRFPNIAVTIEGTLLATFGSSSLKVRRSSDAGRTWGDEIIIAARGIQAGGLTVDENSGDVIAFVEEKHPPAKLTIYRSSDHGQTWKIQATAIKGDKDGNVPAMHMNERGITLRHGKHKGRLIRASRWYAGKNDRSLWDKHYTNAIYSDDGGQTWRASEPFPAMGTGEATLAELADGTIYYNSRRHWAPAGKNPRRRWTAISKDGGATWIDLKFCENLPDGPQDTNYGCMAGLVRLPIKGQDVLIYSNCDSPQGRKNGTVWASFDGGKTWPVKRVVFAGRFAYSSLAVGRPKTSSEGSIYLHFEGGPKGASTVAAFNLSWLLEGTKTANGTVPKR